MKTFCSILFVLSTVFPSLAVDLSFQNSGSLDLKLMATAQVADNVVISDKTKCAVETTVSRSTVSNWFLNSADILKLLENSYNTNFPTGSQLAVTLINTNLIVYVADATGSNLVSFASILLIDPSIITHTGSQTVIAKTGAPENSGNTVDTTTQTVFLFYNDNSLTPADETHTEFHMSCLLVGKSSLNLANNQIKDAIKFEGVGDGTIRGQPVILQGGGSAKIAGTTFFP
jgi:hypothetical protein